MGIAPLHAELIISDHKRRPLPDTVHLLGRQTVHLSFERACEMIASHGVTPAAVPLELDQDTVGAKQKSGQDLITDRMFFALLGVRNVIAIDHTDYEGAELIIDLNVPLNSEHEGIADFIYGGSVIDNIFDPAAYIRNVARLLRSGGRLVEQTILSQHHHPYVLITPAWIVDYFAVNRFRNCTMYLTEYSGSSFAHMYGVTPTPDEFLSDFGPPRDQLATGLAIIAEKGSDSTWHRNPIQDQYRSAEDSVAYSKSFSTMETLPFMRYPDPTSTEIGRLGLRASKGYQYLGVFRWGDPPQDVTDGIKIVEASYGLNCLSSSINRSGILSVYKGNVTSLMASLANGLDQWDWIVDVQVLGDPAPQQGKALEVHFVHLKDPARRLRSVFLDAEAHGKRLILDATSE